MVLYNNDNFKEQAIEFVKDIFKIYIEDRDISLLITKLHDDICWYSTGMDNVCRGLENATQLLSEEVQTNKYNIKIVKQYYEACCAAENICIVFGDLYTVHDQAKNNIFDMYCRFSMTCILEDNELKLYHAYFSISDISYSEKYWFYQSLDNDKMWQGSWFNQRTKILEHKSRVLEKLASNISGGVEVCKFDQNFTILYASEGFNNLTGYNSDEIMNGLSAKHIALVYPDDTKILTEKIYQQIETSNSFSVEYRIVRKDGEVIWVLDNGNIFTNEDGEQLVQCILTDITKQKEQEEALRISEKRYEIAMQLLDVTMFEYDILTKELLLFESEAEQFGVSTVIPNGPNALIDHGVVLERSISDFMGMYQKIHDGAPQASCVVRAKEKDGSVHDYELTLNNVFDNAGRPIRAIGVRKNISAIRKLEKEQEFAQTLASDRYFVLEADMNDDVIIQLHDTWASNVGALSSMSFSNVIKLATDNLIHESHRKLIHEKLSKENIINEFNHNNPLFTFDYKRQAPSSAEYMWCQATVNIVMDTVTGHIHIRLYHADINEQKCKERKAAKEMSLYESMVANAQLAYEVNITQDIAVRGHENWTDLYGISVSNNYSKMISDFCTKVVYSQDKPAFLDSFLRKNIIKRFSDGERQIICEYRKLQKGKEPTWVSCALHLYEDPESNDIRGYSYVKDINAHKQEEMDLKYKAEHDALTGLYNRGTVEKMIIEFLETPEAIYNNHAFLIVDIDYFKNINDTFGHIYGDSVLAQVSGKLQALFHKEDLVGRQGGDEFCIFIKNVNNKKIVTDRAQAICDSVRQSYSENGIECSISASVGIAFYGEHGTTYEELYEHADKSLYEAKNKGRDQYAT